MKKALSIGGLPLGDVPLVVGVVSTESTLAHVNEIRPRPFDVAEFRVDLIGVDSEGWIDAARRMVESGTPVLLTIRHRGEGGHWYRDEEERAAVYKAALPYVSAVDIEIGSGIFSEVTREAKAAGRLVVASFHDFAKTPPTEELESIVNKAAQGSADVVKLATFINADHDAARLKALLKTFGDRHLCALGMGPLGAETRVSLPLAGSCMTYGFVDQCSAPGQFSASKLRERLVAEHPGYRSFARTRT